MQRDRMSVPIEGRDHSEGTERECYRASLHLLTEKEFPLTGSKPPQPAATGSVQWCKRGLHLSVAVPMLVLGAVVVAVPEEVAVGQEHNPLVQLMTLVRSRMLKIPGIHHGNVYRKMLFLQN